MHLYFIWNLIFIARRLCVQTLHTIVYVVDAIIQNKNQCDNNRIGDFRKRVNRVLYLRLSWWYTSIESITLNLRDAINEFFSIGINNFDLTHFCHFWFYYNMIKIQEWFINSRLISMLYIVINITISKALCIDNAIHCCILLHNPYWYGIQTIVLFNILRRTRKVRTVLIHLAPYSSIVLRKGNVLLTIRFCTTNRFESISREL